MNNDKIRINKKSSFVWRAIGFAAAGVLCLAVPGLTVSVLSYFAGGVLILIGVLTFVMWLRSAQLLPANTIQLLSAIAEVALGITFLLRPDSMAIVVGVFMLCEGLSAIVRSINYRRAGSRNWTWLLGMGIGAALIGVCAMIKPVAGVVTISVLIGIGCLIISFNNILAATGLGKVERFLNRIKEEMGQHTVGSNSFEDAQVIEEDKQ
ncbi:MAG: DUF308 domain-containing protein [Bacteroidales bacterium]|nr:DUF308 domain-containing protein [Bacteroidales bacterium]